MIRMGYVEAVRTILELDEKLDSGRHLTPSDEREYNRATTAIVGYVR
jgi:hypothetical protein